MLEIFSKAIGKRKSSISTTLRNIFLQYENKKEQKNLNKISFVVKNENTHNYKILINTK